MVSPGEFVDYPDLQGRWPGAVSRGTGLFRTPSPSPSVEATSIPCQALGVLSFHFISQPSQFTKPAGVKGESVSERVKCRGQNLNPDLMTRGLEPVPPSLLEVPLRATGDREDTMVSANVTLWEGHWCLHSLVCPGKSHIFRRTASWCPCVEFTPRAAEGKA